MGHGRDAQEARGNLAGFLDAALPRSIYADNVSRQNQIEQSIEREDRAQFKEVAQLLLGKAAAAGLKELAPQAAKLLQSAESERSWAALRQAVTEFARISKPESPRQAA